jgi:polyphosphate kinase 2 (PPK2 family)
MESYEEVMGRTSTPGAPWFVIPSDCKWYRNLCVSQVVVNALEGMDLNYPKVTWDPSKVTVK